MNCQNNIFSINSPPPLPVFLGFPGENGTRPVQIDVSAWLDEFPEGAVSIVYTRADKLTYVVVVNAIGPVVTWEPERRDLVTGACQIQVQIQQGDAVKKNHIVDCVVGKALDDPNDPPEEPQPSYVEDVIDAADRAEAAVEHYPQIRNGYWWVWDVESGEWVNTGVKATGEGGGTAADAVLYTPQTLTPAQQEQARENIGAGTYSKPSGGIHASDLASAVQTSLGKADTALQTAPVTSVNNKTGAVTLTASDVNALPDSTVIPTVPQMATDSNMSDWTSGKTVDAAVLKADFQNALAELYDVQGEVARKANASDIPTTVSELTNDSGYQTAAQVQSAIAPLQTKAITDTGGYYKTDTVEGALQEIGAELAGVNTLIGSGVIS